MRSSLVAFLSAAVSAQSTNFSACCNVDPNTVQMTDRLAWCRAQTNTCPLICPNGQTSKNTCDPNALTYDCECLSGSTPNISDYSQTLPSLECDAWKGQCVNNSANNLAGQTFCLSFLCGSKNAGAVGAGASAIQGGGQASSTSSGSSGGATSTSSSGSTPSASKSAAEAAVILGREYGTGALLVSVMALFGFAL